MSKIVSQIRDPRVQTVAARPFVPQRLQGRQVFVETGGSGDQHVAVLIGIKAIGSDATDQDVSTATVKILPAEYAWPPEKLPVNHLTLARAPKECVVCVAPDLMIPFALKTWPTIFGAVRIWHRRLRQLALPNDLLFREAL